MHSIHIASGKKAYSTITPDENGQIVLRGGEFGWEVKAYRDPLTKANYAAVDTIGNEVLRAMLIEVIKNHTGAKDVIFDISEDYDKSNYSYIDHQSMGTSLDAFESEQKLKDFIFYPDSVLITDNDNH
jgi:hypothetical protein